MDESALYEELGRLVRQHRERLGMSQETLAAAIELSRASIANIETGRQRIPLHHLFSLARALKVDADALLPRSKKMPATAIDRPIKASLNLNEREEADVARAVGTVQTTTKVR